MCGKTSILYYYPTHDLDRSAEVVGGYRFVGKFVYYFTRRRLKFCRSSAILRMMYGCVGDYFFIYNIDI